MVAHQSSGAVAVGADQGDSGRDTAGRGIGARPEEAGGEDGWRRRGVNGAGDHGERQDGRQG